MIKWVEPLLIQGLNAFIKVILATWSGDCWEHRASLSCYEKHREFLLWIFRCCLYVKSTILYYDLASLPFEGQFVISRGEVLKTLYSILFTVVEVNPRTILYHFKEINWIGTHWRGTQRHSPVKGVNFVINFCLWISDSVLFYPHLFISFAFHFCLSI